MTKKRDLERELTEAGYVKLSGTGAKHDKFRRGDVTVTVPRHRGIRKEAGLL